MAVYKQRSMTAAAVPPIVAHPTQKSRMEFDIRPKTYPILKAADGLLFSSAMISGTKHR
jgi:hypothetical protein